MHVVAVGDLQLDAVLPAALVQTAAQLDAAKGGGNAASEVPCGDAELPCLFRFEPEHDFLAARFRLRVDVVQVRQFLEDGDHRLGDLHQPRRRVADEAYAHAPVAVPVPTPAAPFRAEVEVDVGDRGHHLEDAFLDDGGGKLAVLAHGDEHVGAVVVEGRRHIGQAEFVGTAHDGRLDFVDDALHALQRDGAAHPEAQFERLVVLFRLHVDVELGVTPPARSGDQRGHEQGAETMVQGEQHDAFVDVAQTVEHAVLRFAPTLGHARQQGRDQRRRDDQRRGDGHAQRHRNVAHRGGGVHPVHEQRRHEHHDRGERAGGDRESHLGDAAVGGLERTQAVIAAPQRDGLGHHHGVVHQEADGQHQAYK